MRIPAPRPRFLRPAVPVTALANVTVLAALLFGAATLPRTDGTALALPGSSLRVEAARGSAVVVVALEGAGAAYRFSDGQEPSREVEGPHGLFLRASRVVASDPGRPFVIRADARLPYRVVDETFEALRRAGVRRVVLETRPPAPAEASP